MACAGHGPRHSAAKPPDKSTEDDQTDRDQLRAAHDAAKHFAAARIVANEFEEIACDAVQDQKRCEDLSVEFLSLEQPHQDEKVGEFNRSFKQLGWL